MGRLLDPAQEVSRIPAPELLHCPECGTLLRPGIVRLGEALEDEMLEEIQAWIDEKRVDLMFVVGTAARVWPAAGFVVQARTQGAAPAIVNTDMENLGTGKDLKHGDFYFVGNSAELLSKLFRTRYQSRVTRKQSPFASCYTGARTISISPADTLYSRCHASNSDNG